MLNEIETAFGQRLAAAPVIAPIVWPNRTAAPSKPYLDVQHVPTSNDSMAISGTGGEVQRGYFIVTVVASANDFTKTANAKAAEVKARFPMGLTLEAGTRKFRVLRPPQMLSGFADDTQIDRKRAGTDWRQPVRVDYIVTAR